MTLTVAQGLLVPFFGTAIGAMCVLFMKNKSKNNLQKPLMGFAAGVMIAASVWSLLLPSIEKSASHGRLSFVPAVIGFCSGIICLLLSDKLTDKLLTFKGEASDKAPRAVFLLILAVVIHNIPEGMAVGAAYANAIGSEEKSAFSAAFILALGIAIQNFPEGAIISMPLASGGTHKGKAFLYGVLSGAVEPLAGLLTVLLSSLLIPILPYLLSLAAGAMFYVVIRELIPEMNDGESKSFGILMFSFGFSLMLSLDVALG